VELDDTVPTLAVANEINSKTKSNKTGNMIGSRVMKKRYGGTENEGDKSSENRM